MSGNIDDVNAPRSIKNIVLEVMEYIEKRPKDKFNIQPRHPTDFESYDNALKAVWPELYKACPEAAILVAVSIFVEIAERWDFQVEPSELKDLKL